MHGQMQRPRGALITGASSGIGRALAIRIAKTGRRVTLVARDQVGLEALAREIELSGGTARVLVADLSTREERSRVTQAMKDEDVNLAVFAAGYGHAGSFLESDTHQDIDMIEVNCTAVVDLVRVAGARMKVSGGTIVLFSSLVGWQGVPMSATYAATKAFVQSLGEALAVELASNQINVLTCAPGPVHSGFAARAGMTLQGADAADGVADGVMGRLTRNGTIVPGRVGKLLTFALGGLPRFVRVRIMGRIMAGMARPG